MSGPASPRTPAPLDEETLVADLCRLIERPSVTPEDAGCQGLLADALGRAGFTCESMPFGDVSNLFASHGQGAPVVCFLGHTDVVPPGPDAEWSSPPFVPTLRDGLLYGRGAADMKASLVAMQHALVRFVEAHPDHPGTVSLLVTSDEEGAATDGTVKVVEALGQRGIRIDHCLVGEPSSREVLGDQLRVGRRGSLRGMLTVHGIQGHVAYPHLADNAVHRLVPILTDMLAETWDQGDEHFPPTTFQVSNLNAGTGAPNVVPGVAHLTFNLRFGPKTPEETIRARIQALVDRHDAKTTLAWKLSGNPFRTPQGPLLEATLAAVEAETGRPPRCDTGGGTSDGRFVAPTGAAVVELGPVAASIHKVNEHVRTADLVPLARMYEGVLTRLCGG